MLQILRRLHVNNFKPTHPLINQIEKSLKNFTDPALQIMKTCTRYKPDFLRSKVELFSCLNLFTFLPLTAVATSSYSKQ